MKWNIEWVDLKNIEQMAAECWRMSDRQLMQYCKELWYKRELVFAGELGKEFLRLMCESVDSGTALDWSKLQKDVRMIMEMIQDGQEKDQDYWKNRYQELVANSSAYFYTVFGGKFVEHLAVKLELNLTEDQKLLRRDIHVIQGICDTCNWEKEEEIQKALLILNKKERNSFSSWLGEGFVDLLEQKYGKEEVIIEPFLAQESEPEKHENLYKKRTVTFTTKLAWMLVVCVSIGVIGVFLYIRTQGDQSRFKMPNLTSVFKSVISGETYSKDGGADQEILSDRYDSSTGSVQDQTISGNSQTLADRRQEQTIVDNGTQKNDIESEQYSDEVSQSGDAFTDQDIYAEEAQQSVSMKEKKDHAKEKKTVDSLDKNTANTGQQNSSKTVVMPEVLSQYRSFYKKYPDLFGWLKIPGTEIDHPVMQSDDEKRGERYYYLHRDYTGKKAEEGSLFVESNSSSFPQDGNTVIYGHNMSNGHNFGILEMYKDRDFYESHQTIQYDTIYETGTYQIAAVLMSRVLYQEEKGFRYYQFYNYSTDSEFQECLDFINESKLYDTGVELQYGDKLLMLSTCEYSRENGRLVIVAKRVEQ